jgi:adenine-specific DNA-methyltransferase
MAKSTAAKSVETIRHEADTRKNIPTAEYRSVMGQAESDPVRLRYPRNTDLDPQLVWRGKDEQDWSDLVVQAPPLQVQENVHPEVLIAALVRASERHPPERAYFQFQLNHYIRWFEIGLHGHATP